MLAENDVVKTCTSLIQRLTTRVRGPSISGISTNPALVSSTAVAAAAISNMGTERARLESKYADMLGRSRKHAATSPPPLRNNSIKRESLVLNTDKSYPYRYNTSTKDSVPTYRRETVISSDRQYPYTSSRGDSIRTSNSRDKTPYRMMDYTKPAPAVAPGKYQYRTRQRSAANLQTSASSAAIFPSKSTRVSPPLLNISATSKRRQFASSSRQNQSEQIDPVAISRSKLVLSGYEEHLNGNKPEKIAKTKFDDISTEAIISTRKTNITPTPVHNSNSLYFSKTLDETKTKPIKTETYRQKSEAAKNSFKNLSTSKSCHTFASKRFSVSSKTESMDTRDSDDSSTLEREEAPQPPKRKDIDALLLKYSIIDDAYSGKVNLSSYNVAPVNTGATYVSRYNVAPAPVNNNNNKNARSVNPYESQQPLQSFKPTTRYALRNYRVSNLFIIYNIIIASIRCMVSRNS
jgi:hypothetical protein